MSKFIRREAILTNKTFKKFKISTLYALECIVTIFRMTTSLFLQDYTEDEKLLQIYFR